MPRLQLRDDRAHELRGLRRRLADLDAGRLSREELLARGGELLKAKLVKAPTHSAKAAAPTGEAAAV